VDADEDGLPDDQIGAALQQALGFLATNTDRRIEWLVEPDLKGASLLSAERSIPRRLPIASGFAEAAWISPGAGF
jgi:hypothetical protein